MVYNHVTEVLTSYAKTYGDVYLISRFFSIRENFMLAKISWFTVFYQIHQLWGPISTSVRSDINTVRHKNSVFGIYGNILKVRNY